jgi:hypothetical protein
MKELTSSNQLSTVMGADNGPKSVNLYGPVGVLQSKFNPDTPDGGTAAATAVSVAATTVDQCFGDDDPERKGLSSSCGMVSVLFGAFAFLSSTASVNRNFADAKKERADAKKERADAKKERADAKKETALRFELQDLHRQRDSLLRQRDSLLTARRFDSLARMIRNMERQAMRPQGGGQQVDIDPNGPQIEEIDSKIKEKAEELKLKLKRINDYNAEGEVGGYGLLT